MIVHWGVWMSGLITDLHLQVESHESDKRRETLVQTKLLPWDRLCLMSIQRPSLSPSLPHGCSDCWWFVAICKGPFTREPRAVTMKLWAPKRKCPKALVPTHLPNSCSVVMDLLKCSVKQSPTLGAHTHAHGFWVGMSAMLLLMGGHRFCASMHPTSKRSQTSRM
jgi:hypothetical protein